MPLYDYECKCGQTTEEFFHIGEYPSYIQCPECGRRAHKILNLVAVHGEEATWIDDNLNASLCGPSDPPITTRTEYKRHLKQHGLEPMA